jgi:hypothetical protein
VRDASPEYPYWGSKLLALLIVGVGAPCEGPAPENSMIACYVTWTMTTLLGEEARFHRVAV